MDRDANGRFDDAFEVGERIGAGGLGTVHACRARGNVNAKIPRGMPLVVKTVRVRLDAGGCVRANVPTSGRVDAEIRALRRLDACAERDSNAASAMFPSLVAAFSGRHVEKRSPEDAARNVTSSAARLVMTNPVGASSCDLLRLRAEARERRGDENAQFPESEARFYAAQIVVALRYLHARARLAHGDVKPENVLVRRGTGAVALCDFDLARSLTTKVSPKSESEALRNADDADDDVVATESAAEGTASRATPRSVVGTPEYVAPETARGVVAGATAQTDWYQLGVFAFELVFGTTPFAAPFGVVSMTLRAVEANDLRFFDALFAAAATTDTSGVSENRFSEKRKSLKRKETSHTAASVPFLRFTRALLEGDPESRLGDADVRRAEFFACVDWEALERGERGIAGRAARARGAREDWILFLSEENS